MSSKTRFLQQGLLTCYKYYIIYGVFFGDSNEVSGIPRSASSDVHNFFYCTHQYTSGNLNSSIGHRWRHGVVSMCYFFFTCGMCYVLCPVTCGTNIKPIRNGSARVRRRNNGIRFDFVRHVIHIAHYQKCVCTVLKHRPRDPVQYQIATLASV